MSAQNKTLSFLIHLASEQRDKVAVRFATAQRRLAEATGKLEMLTRFNAEYLEGMHRASDTTSVVRMGNYRAFLTKLELAKKQQEIEVSHCQSNSDGCFKALCAAEQKVKSLETLKQRRDQEMLRAEIRADQKRTDEFASRAASQRQAAGDHNPTHASLFLANES